MPNYIDAMKNVIKVYDSKPVLFATLHATMILTQNVS
jgi:hypothetical protein